MRKRLSKLTNVGVSGVFLALLISAIYEYPAVCGAAFLIAMILILLIGYAMGGKAFFKNPIPFLVKLYNMDELRLQIKIEARKKPRYPWEEQPEVRFAISGDAVGFLEEVANRYRITIEDAMQMLTRTGAQVLIAREKGYECLVHGNGEEYIIDPLSTLPADEDEQDED